MFEDMFILRYCFGYCYLSMSIVAGILDYGRFVENADKDPTINLTNRDNISFVGIFAAPILIPQAVFYLYDKTLEDDAGTIREVPK